MKLLGQIELTYYVIISHKCYNELNRHWLHKDILHATANFFIMCWKYLVTYYTELNVGLHIHNCHTECKVHYCIHFGCCMSSYPGTTANTTRLQNTSNVLAYNDERLQFAKTWRHFSPTCDASMCQYDVTAEKYGWFKHNIFTKMAFIRINS